MTNPEVLPTARAGLSPRRQALRNPQAVFGALILAVMLLAAVLAPLLAPFDPSQQDLSRVLEGPSSRHLLGTDDIGRDVLSRILYGGRVSLSIGVAATLVGALTGVPLGLAAGYFGGALDAVVRLLTDTLLAFAGGALLGLTFVAVFGPSMGTIILATAIGIMPQFIRLARGQALLIREQTYVEAAALFGLSGRKVIQRHILPNSIGPILVFAMINVGLSVVIASGFGFLGLGIQSPQIEWGTMLGESRSQIFNAGHVAAASGMAIFLFALGANLVGDGLRDLIDPRTKERHA